MNFRDQVSAQFAAKPSTGPTLEQAKKINSERLNRKRAALAAEVGKVIYQLAELDVDSWLETLGKADVKASARLAGIHSQAKTAYYAGKAQP
jgi:hypothetical protein